MTDNTSADAAAALTALGIDADVAATATTAPEAPVETTEAPAAEAPTVEGEAQAPAEAAFAIGEISDLSFDEVPVAERTFSARKSQYGFEDVAAPGTDGKKFHGKIVPFTGGDKDKFKRSVQSAATGQNRSAKNAGAPNYYVTRTAENEGSFVGMYIIRTDERPAAAE